MKLNITKPKRKPETFTLKEIFDIDVFDSIYSTYKPEDDETILFVKDGSFGREYFKGWGNAYMEGDYVLVSLEDEDCILTQHDDELSIEFMVVVAKLTLNVEIK